MSGERRFVDDLRRRAGVAPDGQVWIGDDAAVLDGGLVAAADALVEGVHFDLAWCSPADAGWKALAVNLSDLAAMGAVPTGALLSLVVPDDRSGVADGVADGVLEAAANLDCPLVGGDTVGGPALVIAVTVLGSAGPPGPVLRSGARVGDAVFVTGSLGGSRHALDHLRAGREPDPDGMTKLTRPVPRLAEGRAAASGGATAMIDVSDGLSTDLLHLCDESGVGVRVDLDAVPLGPGASAMDALDGGDEYELCFTAAEEADVRAAFAAAGLEPPTVVGSVAGEGERVVVVEGHERELVARGWEHEVS